jgi:hypothetical protein
LEPLLGPAALEIMFHELWIGGERNACWKDRLIGLLQRLGVLKLMRRLTPRCVHTSNRAYIELLKRNGVHGRRLPIYSTIPVRPAADGSWVYQTLQAAGLGVHEANRAQFWLFGLFGTLHPVWPSEPIFGLLADAARRHGKRIIITTIGRVGAGEGLWRSLVQNYSRTFSFHAFGEQPAETVSGFFNVIDFGIATTPWRLIGKSSTAAAMVEHGLPVIVNRDDVHFRGLARMEEDLSPLLIKMDQTLPHRLMQLQRGPSRARLPEVAKQFLRDLQGSFPSR